MNKTRLEEALAEAVMCRPREFFIKNRRYFLYPATLGVTLMTRPLLSALGLDSALMAGLPAFEAVRMATEKPEEVCRVISLRTFRRPDDLWDSTKVAGRARELSGQLSAEELAQLLLLVIAEPGSEELIVRSGIREEQLTQSRIAKLKGDGNTLAFGGRTLFGSLIAPACERLHLTPEEVVWRLPLVQLRMLMADWVTSVYLTDEERKQLRLRPKDSSQTLRADDPANFAAIRAMDWK